MEISFVPPDPPRTPKSSAARRRILAVAVAQFLEQGYAAASLRDIAQAAGLTKSAIYGHYRSKGQLLVEVIRWTLAEHEHSTEFAEASADPRRRVSLLYDPRLHDVQLLLVDAAATARRDPYVAAGLVEIERDRQARIRAAVSTVDDPATTAWLISALSLGIAMKRAIDVPFPETTALEAGLTTMFAQLDVQ
jgi:AcrR family transcriptional regulator